MHRYKKHILLFIVQLVCISAFCQKKKAAAQQQLPPANLVANIRVSAKAYGDSIVIRWAPTADWAWTSLNYYGYKIVRIDISEAKHPKREVITQQALKPLTLDQFKKTFTANDKYAAIAAQCLYGKNFSVNLRQGQGGQADKANVWNSRYAYALQVADYDARVANAEALRFTDKKVQKNGIYIYRVYTAQLVTQGKIDTGNVMIENNGIKKPMKPAMHEAIARDRLVELHWDRAQQETYSGYYIERSNDGRNFQPITQVPYFASRPDSSHLTKDSSQARIFDLLRTQQVFVDSLPENYHKYYYRIRGINAFAELSDFSDTLIAMGKDLTAPSAAIVQNPVYTGGKKIMLKWKKAIKEKDFKGYIITRAHLVSGPYTALTPAMLGTQVTQFEDTAAYQHGQNFYMVLVVDTAGNMAPSIPAMGLVPDKTPPAAPTGLKGFIEKNGLVHLSWDRNAEEDLKGYKVYFANSNEHIYSQITIAPTTDTSFTDSITLHTLTKNIWYKIVAVDENNNHSAYSAPVSLKKPDIVPPIAPLASKVYVDTGGVQIDWIQSSSADVVRYAIFRKEKNSDWALMQYVKHDSTKKTFHFTDRTMQRFHEYNYSAEAIDEDSLHSAKSTAVNASVKTVPDLPPLKTLTAAYDDKARQAKLHWQFTDNGNYFFVLYKATGNEPLSKFYSADAKATQYNDDIPAAAKGTIRYAIQVMYKDRRGRTKVSDPVAVTIPSR